MDLDLEGLNRKAPGIFLDLDLVLEGLNRIAPGFCLDVENLDLVLDLDLDRFLAILLSPV